MGRFLRTLIIIGAGSFALSPVTAEQIYKWVDQQGVTHYSEQAPANKSVETIRTKSHRAESKAPQPLPVEGESDIQEPESQAESAAHPRAKKSSKAKLHHCPTEAPGTEKCRPCASAGRQDRRIHLPCQRSKARTNTADERLSAG